MSIESSMAKTIKFNDVIPNLARKKARKAGLFKK